MDTMPIVEDPYLQENMPREWLVTLNDSMDS